MSPPNERPFTVSDKIEELHSVVTLGNDITRKLMAKKSVVSFLLNRSKAEANSAILELINSDLSSEEGLTNARAAQATIKRYDDMNTWLTEAVMNADDAQEELAELLGEDTASAMANWKQEPEDETPDKN